MAGSAREASGEGFPKAHRLRARHEFLRAKARGRKLHTQHLIALVLPSPSGERRLGITVSGKVGNSVERNRVKRWLREIFRKEAGALPDRIDLVLIAKSGAPSSGMSSLREQFLDIARRLSQAPGGSPRRTGR